MAPAATVEDVRLGGEWRISEHVRRKRWASQQVMPEILASGMGPRLRACRRRRGTRPGARRFDRSRPTEVLRAVPDDARQERHRSRRRDTGGAVGAPGRGAPGHGGPGLVLRPGNRKAGPPGRLLLQGQPPLRGRHRQREADLGALAHAPPHGAGRSLRSFRRRALRRTAAAHLRSWWAQNPFLSGVHWTSGIEAGLRLITWVWVRRLLDGWAGAAELFERNDVALCPNLVAPALPGQLSAVGGRPPTITSSPKPPGFWSRHSPLTGSPRAPRWAEEAARVLEQELTSNTFPSGVNREMAFDYHGFVTELAVVAAAEADWDGRPFSEDLWALLYRMFDVVAATVDVKLRAPRQGDGDNGRALVLDRRPRSGRRASSPSASPSSTRQRGGRRSGRR